MVCMEPIRKACSSDWQTFSVVILTGLQVEAVRDTMKAAHTRRIIHSDFNERHLILDEDHERLVIIDWELCKTDFDSATDVRDIEREMIGSALLRGCPPAIHEQLKQLFDSVGRDEYFS